MSKIQAVVPICNNQNHIKSCISSLLNSSSDMEITAIDMESMDDSVKILKEHFPNVNTVLLNENKGLGYALNCAVRDSGAEYILTFSPYAEAQKGYAENIIRCMEGDKDIFSASSVLVYKNSPKKIHSAGFFYTASGKIIKAHKDKNLDKIQAAAEKKSLSVFAPNIYGAVFRRKIFDEIGGFDENFFKFCEDIDIGWRASLFGYKNVSCVGSIACIDADAVKNDLDFRLIARNNSFMRYKNMPGWQRRLHSLAYSAENRKTDGLCRKKGINSYTAGIKEAELSCRNTCKTRYTKNFLKEQFKLEMSFKNKFI